MLFGTPLEPPRTTVKEIGHLAGTFGTEWVTSQGGRAAPLVVHEALFTQGQRAQIAEDCDEARALFRQISL